MRGDWGGKKRKAAFQVICLGSRGGSTEDNTTGLLVRSTGSKWAKGSVLAVDAGVHLSAMIRILSEIMPLTSTQLATKNTTINSGPFAGLSVPHISAYANAAYILREMIHTFLITHAHLDHLSGFVINTPAFQPAARAKRCAALPHTIEAIRDHIFNDIIWPNLSDENGGVGLVTYMRLTEGGNDFLGHGDGRGYIEVAEGLGTKGWSVTHGTCRKAVGAFSSGHSHSHSRHRTNSMGFPPPDNQYSRRHSRVSDHVDSAQDGYVVPTTLQRHNTGPLTPQHHPPSFPPLSSDKHPYDSSAFFIRDQASCTELLIFGDVEPDSIALHPRNHVIWQDAAPKIANGTLSAIFIECSFSDITPDQFLFGHLCPRHLIAELEVLAEEVLRIKQKMHIQSPAPPPDLMDPPSPQSHRSAKRARIESPSQASTNGTSAYVGSGSTSPAPPRQPPAFLRRKTQPAVGSPHLRASSSSQIPGPKSPGWNPPKAPNPPKSPINRRGSASPNTPRTPTRPGHSYSESHAQSQSHPVDVLDPHPRNGDENSTLPSPAVLGPALKDLTVYIIHVKDTYEDGPDIADVIHDELQVQGKEKGLGCGFVICSQGGSYFI